MAGALSPLLLLYNLLELSLQPSHAVVPAAIALASR